MRLVVALLGLALMSTACTSDPPAPTPKELPPVTHPPAKRVADKDEKAVLATLDGLNPCALVDTPKGGTKRQRSPHLCLLDTADRTSIHVAVEGRDAHASSWALPTKQIAGATVTSIYPLDAYACELQIPVSFQYTIKVFTSRPRSGKKPATGAVCKIAETYAATAIPRLRTPDKIRHPADRPDLSKNACGVLTAAFTEVGRPAKPNGLRAEDSIDSCGLESGDIHDAVLALLVEPGPPEGGWGTKWRTIGGKAVYLAEEGCRWTWSEGRFEGEDNRLITLSFPRCKDEDQVPPDLPADLTKAVIDELAVPQQPVATTDLVYQPGQPTEPNPGACVDYQADACEPAVAVQVPAGAGFVTEAARADHHVACAATADAVHGQFPALRPVVPGRSPLCSFVEPEHALLLEVRVQRDDDDLGAAGKPAVEKRVTIAGHAAIYREHEETESSRATTSVCVDTGYDPGGYEEPWFWCFAATFLPSRSGAPADPGGGTRLVPLVTAFAQGRLT